MAVALLEDWCKGVDLDPRKAMLIVGIPLDCSEDEIKETLPAGLQSLCSYTVRGTMFLREENTKVAFVELANPIDYAQVPSKIPGKGSTWEVVVKPRNPDDEFYNRLNCFLKHEGRRMVDVVKTFGSGHLTAGAAEGTPPEAGAQGAPVGLQPLTENMWYRKLKTFSGTAPLVPGEEPFEVWLEQTTEVMQLWQVSEAEKRRRLLESLCGPALSTVRMLRANNEAITAKQCLDALKQIFGNQEDYRTCQLRFLQSFPKAGEKLSAFLLRLEPLLQKAVRHSPTSLRTMDTLRLKHVLAHATMSAALRGKLEFLDQRACPPTFLEFMKVVQDEEKWETTRLLVETQKSMGRGRKGPVRHMLENSSLLLRSTAQAGSLGESSTETVQLGILLTPKRSQLSCCYSSGDEGQHQAAGTRAEHQPPQGHRQRSAAEGWGNGVGAGAMSHPKP